MEYENGEAVCVDDLVALSCKDYGIVLIDFDTGALSDLSFERIWPDYYKGVMIFAEFAGLIMFEHSTPSLKLVERKTRRLHLFPSLQRIVESNDPRLSA